MPFQLPALQTYPGIETPRPADAMMKAQTMKNEMARTGIAQQNADTAQKYLGLAGQKFEQDKETQKFTKSMRAMEFAFQNSRTPEEFASSYKEMTGEDVKVKFSGKNITMQFPDKDGNMMEVSGPSEVVADAVAAFSKDPSHALDPEKGKVSFEYLARQGVSFKKIPAKGSDAGFTLGEGQARYDASGKKIASRPKTAGDGKDYEGNRAQLVDDTRSYYHEKGRHLLDPESGLIQMGTKDDPDKYVKEYKKILTEMQTDMKRISNGKLPSWYKSDKKDRKVVRTGVHKGRKVAEYDDGSIEYAD